MELRRIKKELIKAEIIKNNKLKKIKHKTDLKRFQIKYIS